LSDSRQTNRPAKKAPSVKIKYKLLHFCSRRCSGERSAASIVQGLVESHSVTKTGSFAPQLATDILARLSASNLAETDKVMLQKMEQEVAKSPAQAGEAPPSTAENKRHDLQQPKNRRTKNKSYLDSSVSLAGRTLSRTSAKVRKQRFKLRHYRKAPAKATANSNRAGIEMNWEPRARQRGGKPRKRQHRSSTISASTRCTLR
jgi:hypothetical protein